MKAIILAAGEGTRLKPLTNTVPKPLIKIFGRSIIEHNIKNIYKYVSEIIIVVKYKKELIKKEFSDNYKKTKITYFEQGNDKGTGAAIRGIKSDNDVIILNGDSIFDKKDLKKLIQFHGYGVLVKRVKNPEKYGIFDVDVDGNITKIKEKPKTNIGNLANLGVYKFDSKILSIVENIKVSTRGEYEITDAINEYVKKFPFKPFEIKGKFIDIGYPWDILTANAHFLENLSKSKIKGTIEKGVTIKGNIVLEKGAIIKSGTYIEGNCYIGKNTSIGPNAHIRSNVVIGDNSSLGHTEIKESSLGDYTKAKHFGYIGSSIIGNNVNIAAGFISMDRRHDNLNIKAMIKGKLINTGLRKLGCIVGDNVRTGVNTLIYPGRIIENDIFTIPGTIIK